MLRMMILATISAVLAACTTAPKQTAADQSAMPPANDQPAMAPVRREPCGDGPVMMLPSDPTRQTGVTTPEGDPIQ